MSVQAAKLTAEKLIDRLGIRTAPVDVERIAAFLDLRIVFDDLGDDISGLLVARDGAASIAVQPFGGSCASIKHMTMRIGTN